MGSLSLAHVRAVSHLDAQSISLSWQLFPSAVGSVLAAGFNQTLVFLGIDSSFCSVEKDFTHWACVQKKCTIQQEDWLGDTLSILQHHIAKSWGHQPKSQAFGVEQLFPLSLLLLGTPFQVRVWQALLDIPYGHTVSYSALAAHLGREAAVRAVASAVAANPISLWLPCHRIVQKNGQNGQFHWGGELKQQLLSAERLHVSHRSLEINAVAC